MTPTHNGDITNKNGVCVCSENRNSVNSVNEIDSQMTIKLIEHIQMNLQYLTSLNGWDGM